MLWIQSKTDRQLNDRVWLYAWSLLEIPEMENVVEKNWALLDLARAHYSQVRNGYRKKSFATDSYHDMISKTI